MKNHLIDLILCLPLLWGLIRGFMRGLIFELALLAALIIASLGSFYLAGKASVYIAETFAISGNYLPAISHLVVFTVIFILIFFLGKALTNVVSSVGLGFPNRLLGGIFGFSKWLIIVSVFVFIVAKFDQAGKILSEEKREISYVFKPLAKVSAFLFELINEKSKK